jgi:NitT/TauT family transport system permease protein
MTGVRQALARGLVGMIAAEFFLSATGLGSLLIIASERFDTAGMLAITLVITLAGVALMAIGRLVEARFARWRVNP